MAFDILGIDRPVDGTPIDRRGEVEFEGRSSFEARQGFPDLVLVHEDDGQGGAVITVEAQNKKDLAKRYRIPMFQAVLALEYQASTWVVVVSFSRSMSELLEEWRDGPPPKVDVLRLDVDTVPKSWLDLGDERPAAVVLAAALHAHAGDLDAARIGLSVALRMPEERRRRYAMTVLAALPEHQRDVLIGAIPVQRNNPLDEIERASGTFCYGHREGLEEGRQEGRQEGLEKGRRLTLVELTLALLADRNVSVDANSEARIRSCESLPQLERWARRAARVASVADLFE